MIFYTYFDDASTGNTQISAIKNINPNQKDNPILSRVLLAMTPQIKQWGNGDVDGTSATIQFPISFGKCFQILAGDVGSGAHPLGASGTNATATIYNASATSVTYRWIAVGKS
jgi:hypothetical protein